MTKKSLFYKNLISLTVYIEDEYQNSPYYFNFVNIPNKLSLGKNSIRFSPNLSMLNSNYDIHIEFIDSSGNVLYYEVPPYGQSDDLNLRLITLYLYNTVPNGFIQMTVVGTAKFDMYGNPVPEEWSKIPNVRYVTTLTFDRSSKNESEILYSVKPNISVSETRRPYNNANLSVSSSYTSYSSSAYYYYYNNTPILELTSGSFTNDMIGGTVIISGSNLEPNVFNYNLNNYTTYSTTIKNIINDTVAELSNPYTASLASAPGNVYFVKSRTPCPINVNYYRTPSFLSSQNYKSFINVNISNLEPISGVVKKVVLNGKSRGSLNAYELIGETDVKNVELLVNTSSLIDYDRRNVGYFISSSAYTNFWNFTNISSSYNTNVLFNSLYLVLNNTSTDGIMTSNVNINYQADSSYELYFNYKTLQSNSEIEIYMSGSAFASKTSEHGKLIGTVNTKFNGLSQNNLYVDFSADMNGTGVLKYVIKSGSWYISDISLKCLNEEGFTPSIFNAYIPINVKSRNDVYDFKIELIDDIGRSSPIFYENNLITISGSNLYIQETDNLLSGSIYLNSTLNNGIELNGSKSMISSVGYSGSNAGFAFWSGSQYISGSILEGPGFYLETGAPNYHSIKATAGGKITIIADISGSAPTGGVTETTFNAYTSSNNITVNAIDSTLTRVSQSLSSSFLPENFASLFGIGCPIDGSGNRTYYLKIKCENGILTFETE